MNVNESVSLCSEQVKGSSRKNKIGQVADMTHWLFIYIRTKMSLCVLTCRCSTVFHSSTLISCHQLA